MTTATRLAFLISILAVASRFILIDQPFVDHWSWRQSDVAAIARNYFQNGFHLGWPQIDWAGNERGYVGTEFPVLPFLAALSYKIFGVHEWVGRSQAVLLFALSLPFFFLLVRKIFGEVAATWALGFYSFAPLGVMASRCFMPDMPSLALSIIGLYFFQRWLESEPERDLKSRAFVASALCISLSILTKLPSVIIGAPLACLAFQRFRKPPLRLGAMVQRLNLWIFAAIALLPSALWYVHAYQISLQFYPHHFFGAGGVRIESAGRYFEIVRRLSTSSLTPVLSILAVLGIITARKKKEAQVLYIWLGAMFVFVLLAGYGNRHPWYQLPLVPIAAAFAGAFCARIMALPLFAPANSYGALFMRAGFSFVVTAFAACALGYAQILYEPVAAKMRDAGLVLQRTTPADALIVAADNGDPTIFYYAGRRGWHFLEQDGIYNGEPRDSAQAIVDFKGLKARGASYLVFSSDTAWWLDYYQELGSYVTTNAQVTEATPAFKIYKLNPTSH